MILPGYGDAKATRALPKPWLVNAVMNKLSPVSKRFPALNKNAARPTSTR